LQDFDTKLQKQTKNSCFQVPKKQKSKERNTENSFLENQQFAEYIVAYDYNDIGYDFKQNGFFMKNINGNEHDQQIQKSRCQPRTYKRNRFFFFFLKKDLTKRNCRDIIVKYFALHLVGCGKNV